MEALEKETIKKKTIAAFSCRTSSPTSPRHKAACRLHNDLPPVRWMAWRYHWGCRRACWWGRWKQQATSTFLTQQEIYPVPCLPHCSLFVSSVLLLLTHRTSLVSSPVWEPTLFRALSHRVRACSVVLVSGRRAWTLSLGCIGWILPSDGSPLTAFSNRVYWCGPTAQRVPRGAPPSLR